NKSLHVESSVAKRGFCLRRCTAKCFLQFTRLAHDPHAPASSASACFQQEGKADALADINRCSCIGYEIAARDDRNSGTCSNTTRVAFVTHRFDGIRLGANEVNSSAFTCPGEIRPF